MKKAILISILFSSAILSSCNNPSMVNEFVNKFYSSLELNEDGTNKSGKNAHYNVAEMRNRAIFMGVEFDESISKIDGRLIFDDSLFKSCLDANSIYSFDRVQNLTGDDHERFTIKLIKTDSIVFKYNTFKIGNFIIENKFNCNKALAYTEVQYSIKDFGTIINKEILEINLQERDLKLASWRDLNIIKYSVPAYQPRREGENTLNEDPIVAELPDNPNDVQTYLYLNIGSLLITDSINNLKARYEEQARKDRQFWRSVGYDLGPEKYYQ